MTGGEKPLRRHSLESVNSDDAGRLRFWDEGDEERQTGPAPETPALSEPSLSEALSGGVALLVLVVLIVAVVYLVGMR